MSTPGSIAVTSLCASPCLDLVTCGFRDRDDNPAYHPRCWADDFEKLGRLVIEAGFARVGRGDFDPGADPGREWARVYVVATK